MEKQAITAAAFIHKDGKLFAPRRAANKTFLPDTFSLPGGHIEYSEDIVGGLKRELNEELKTKVRVGDPFFSFTYINDGNQTHSVEIVYFAVLQNPQEEVKINLEDHSEYRWVTKEEVRELWTEGDNELQAILKGFEIIQNDGKINLG